PPQARARRTGGGIEGRGGARSRPAEGAVVSGSHEDSIIADRGGRSQAAPGRVGPPGTRGQTELRERRALFDRVFRPRRDVGDGLRAGSRNVSGRTISTTLTGSLTLPSPTTCRWAISTPSPSSRGAASSSSRDADSPLSASSRPPGDRSGKDH